MELPREFQLLFVLLEIVNVHVAVIFLSEWAFMVGGAEGLYNPPRIPLSNGSTNFSYAGLRIPVCSFKRALPSAAFSSESGGSPL